MEGNLSVLIENLNGEKGNLIICLTNKEDEFLDSCEEIRTLAAEDQEEVMLEFEHLAPGMYAISLFHDLNDNGELDRSGFHLPKEPFGFSNNPSLLFGRPSFKRCAFKVSGSQHNVQRIRLKRI